MTTIVSAGTGDFDAGATWVGGVAPGAGDPARISAGHVVTITNPIGAILAFDVIGTLAINNDITFDATGGPYMIVSSNGKITTNATRSAPRTISAATTWLFFKVANAGAINLDYIHFVGNRWWLGVDSVTTSYVPFNNNQSNRIRAPGIIERAPVFEEHLCDGRTKSRVYPRGSHAGVLQLSGHLSWSDGYWKMLAGYAAAQTKLCFVSEYEHMPHCRIESFKCSPKPGSLYVPFTLTLVEDV